MLAPKLGAHRTRTVLAKVLDYAAPSLKELAAEAGITWFAIRQYRRGQRTAPPAVVQRLAKALRARGGKLQQLAAELERQAGGR